MSQASDTTVGSVPYYTSDSRRIALYCVYSPRTDLIGRQWPVETQVITVGRATDQTIGVESDERMSRRHVKVVRAVTGGVRVSDEESRNGTFVNGSRVSEQHATHGDVIRTGDTLWVLTEPPSEAETASQDGSPLKGLSQAIGKVRLGIQTVSTAVVGGHPLSVLILGETGCGKEVTAEELHRQSQRRGRLVPVNCAAITETLAESHFFGHVSGAFSGATGNHDGVFVQADNGTLFLDELKRNGIPGFSRGSRGGSRGSTVRGINMYYLVAASARVL